MLSPSSTSVSVPPSAVEWPGIDVLPSLLLPLAGPEELDLDVPPPILTCLIFC